jgi:hypothetical protein
MIGPVRIAQTHPLLAEIVDGIADWDFPDGEVARVLASKALPSTTPYLIAQYRVPIRTERCFGSNAYPHQRYWHVATTIGTGLVKLLPNGPMGALIIRLKPEAAALLIGERMQDLVDAKIDLGNLFNANELSLLEEMLMEASDSTTRFARIESFLLRNLRQRTRPYAALRNVCGAIHRFACDCLQRNSTSASGTCRAVFGRCSEPVRSILRGSHASKRCWLCGKADRPGRISPMPVALPTRRI